MTKVSVTGPKKDLEQVVEELHSLELMDIDDYEGELETGDPGEEAEQLSELLVDVRSLISKLPDVEAERESFTVDEAHEKLPGILEKLDDLKAKQEELERELDNLEERKDFFRRLSGSGLRYKDLQESAALKVWAGRLDEDNFYSEIGTDRFEVFEGDSASAVIYSRERAEEVESALQKASREELQIPRLDEYEDRTVKEIFDDFENRKESIESEIEEVESKRNKLAEKWLGQLRYVEEFLSEQVEKSEAPLKFAATDHAFIAEGWIPEDRYEEFEESLADAAEGRIHVQREESEEEPPVKHDNNRFAQPFESLTDLVSVPRYEEVDPSIVLMLTFPLFFGFMIGDAGYGLTSLAVFYAGYRLFEGAQDIFKSMMYASVATIFFGLLFGDAFGYVLFGHHSDLAAFTGIHLFEKIPLIYHRAEHLGQVFNMAALIGVIHVNLGYGIGFYNEYIRHGLKEAFLEKGSWYLLQIAALLLIIQGPTLGLPVLVLALSTLYAGEGVEGIVEIPSLIANILSYLRIFGVSVAAVALAIVVNSIAETAYAAGGLFGLTFGTLMLLVGHTFNTFIKIMEGFLQGIRLHYVEMFDKFYEGGGKKYAPFGAEAST